MCERVAETVSELLAKPVGEGAATFVGISVVISVDSPAVAPVDEFEPDPEADAGLELEPEPEPEPESEKEPAGPNWPPNGAGGDTSYAEPAALV